MNYRLDKYGNKLSVLGFGCMRFQRKMGRIDLEEAERGILLAYENGDIDITIGADEEYQLYHELGAKCISFGKNTSNEVEITYYYRADLSEDKVQVEEVDETKAGMYYAVYTTKSPRYKTVTLIRNIYVVGVEDNG